MEESKNQNTETFDDLIRRIDDQELKGILLKLKNETRKPNVSWEVIRAVLRSLWDKKKETLIAILPLILK